MSTTFQPNELVTGEVRLSYVNLLAPSQIDGKGEPQYSVKLLIPKTDTATLKALGAARDAARANGVTEGKKPFAKMSEARLAEMSLSLQDGDSPKYSDNNPENKGHWLLNTKSPADKPPGVLNEKREKVTKDSDKATEIYSGMYGRVHLQLFPYDTMGNQGIGASLQNVMKTRDGDPLGGGRKKAEDVFGQPDSPFNEPAATAGAPVASGSPI